MLRRIAPMLLLAMLASPAGAAKLPKALCIAIDGTAVRIVLVVKKVGSTSTAAGKTGFYQLAGEASFPVVATSTLLAGSGRLAGDVLDFAVTGSNLREVDTSFSAVHFQGTWDVVQRTGALSDLYLAGNGAAQAVTDVGLALVEADCAEVELFD